MNRTGFVCLAFLGMVLPLGCGSNSSSTPSSDSKPSSADEKVRAAEKSTAEAAKAKARKDLEKKVEEAKVKRIALTKKLDELKAANHDQWEKIKDDVENSYQDMKKCFE